jgi:hypothetical protein
MMTSVTLQIPLAMTRMGHLSLLPIPEVQIEIRIRNMHVLGKVATNDLKDR